MAELATAGSIVGLVSLSIQACEGLTRYYNDYRSQSEEINSLFQRVEDLKNMCENLKRELRRRLRQTLEPLDDQVAKLISSCRDGISDLESALKTCSTTKKPASRVARLNQLRLRIAYPFKKSTIQRLNEYVHRVQGNLQSALQVVQIRSSTDVEERLTSLSVTAASIENEAQTNGSVVQALSTQLQSLHQAIPPLQQQANDVASHVVVLHSSFRQLNRDVRSLHAEGFQQLAELSRSIQNSGANVETAISSKLGEYSEQMHRLGQDIINDILPHKDEQFMRLEALNQQVESLQISMISLPSLLQSVCKNSDLLLLRESQLCHITQRSHRRHNKAECGCNIERNRLYENTMRKNGLGSSTYTGYNFFLTSRYTNHEATCPLSAIWSSAYTATMSAKRFLHGAISASISITRGAGGFSICPALQYRRMVPDDSPGFALVSFGRDEFREIDTKGALESLLNVRFMRIQRLFASKKASPYDVNSRGDTILHVVCNLYTSVNRIPTVVVQQLFLHFYERLHDIGVPFNETNNSQLTFLDLFISQAPLESRRSMLSAAIVRLLARGAELTKILPYDREANLFHLSPFRDIPWWTWYDHIAYEQSWEILHALDCPPISQSIFRQSEQELVAALQTWPDTINARDKSGRSAVHMSVGWPIGLGLLLHYGADMDVEDLQGFTPVDHGICKGFAEGVGILVSEGCNINVRHTKHRWFRDCLTEATYYLNNVPYGAIGASGETSRAVLQELISSLAKRHRRLNHATAYGNASQIGNDLSATPFSVLGADLGPVYHIPNLTVTVAEMLWQAGFRDIDTPDLCGRTPITVSRHYVVTSDGWFSKLLRNISWFTKKGASLGYPNNRLMETSAQRPNRRATYFLGSNIGQSTSHALAMKIVPSMDENLHDQSFWTECWQLFCSQLDEDHVQVMADILLDTHSDQCTCACSLQGCLSLTMFLKSFMHEPWRLIGIIALVQCLEAVGNDHDWPINGVIRFHTFNKLGLKHTCCEIERHVDSKAPNIKTVVKELDPEEILEIQEEDREGIELLESLLPEFEEKRQGQDLLQFLKGYWATRMEEVCHTRHEVDQQKLRELGITLVEDEGVDARSGSRDFVGYDRTLKTVRRLEAMA